MASIPPLVFFLLTGSGKIALYIFLVASLSDFLDGYLARSRDQVSPFGKFADPIADKLLIIAALVCFVELREVGAAPVILIVGREFLVTGLRLLAILKGVVISASSWGKVKTVSHIVLIVAILAKRGWGINLPRVVQPALIYLGVALALISGLHYFYKNKQLLRRSLGPGSEK